MAAKSKSRLQEILSERYELARAVNKHAIKRIRYPNGTRYCQFCLEWFDEATIGHTPTCIVRVAQKILKQAVKKQKMV